MSYILVFTMVWWVILFMVLPFGFTPDENPQAGNASSAPKTPRLLLKATITTIISLIITATYFYLLANGFLSRII